MNTKYQEKVGEMHFPGVVCLKVRMKVGWCRGVWREQFWGVEGVFPRRAGGPADREKRPGRKRVIQNQKKMSSR